MGILSDWPVECPADWVQFVNEPQTQEELEALRQSVKRGSPFGEEDWQRALIEELGLESTVRPRGRPRKTAAEKAF